MGSTKPTGDSASFQSGDASIQMQYPDTRWSVVAGFLETDPDRFRQSLEWLCTQYRQPLLNYLRRRGDTREHAEDLVQGFILHLIDKERLAKVKMRLGPFRAFLLSELSNYRTDVWRRENTAKAGGGRRTSLDALTEQDPRSEPASLNGMTPEQIFDREWARQVFTAGLEQLQREEEGHGRAALFGRLQPLMTGDRAGADYATIGLEFRLSEAVIKQRVHRLRGRYKEILRELVAQTVSPEDVDDELRHLKAALRS